MGNSIKFNYPYFEMENGNLGISKGYLKLTVKLSTVIINPNCLSTSSNTAE